MEKLEQVLKLMFRETDKKPRLRLKLPRDVSFKHHNNLVFDL